MNIILSNELENVILREISNCQKDVNIVTAFCKLSTLKLVDANINKNITLRKRLLVRFLPSDIISGATDKEIYDYCKDNNWEIFIDFSIHAKTYIFDRVKCILGSANLTNRGLGISSNSNKELSSYFEIADEDYNKILSLYSDSEILDDDLYNQIISSTEDFEIIKYKNNLNINKKIHCLMPEDFPDEGIDIIELYNLKSYKWLISYLKSKEDKSAYFGEITSQVHDIFVKDPRPYRKDIKQYQIALFSAIKRLKPKNLIIERPNYSEKITLIID